MRLRVGKSARCYEHNQFFIVWCDIYLLQLSFQPVAVVGKLVQKQEGDSTKGETISKTIQKHRIHKIENKPTKQEIKHKENINRHKYSN